MPLSGANLETISSRTVLVTGAATGLGLAIARAFCAAGDRVFITDRSPDRVTRALSELEQAGFTAAGCAADVRDEQQVDQQFAELDRAFGPPEIVVANAGIYPNTPFLDLSVEEWDAVIDTNLRGVFLTCQAAARRMVAAGVHGHLIVLSSGAANMAFRGWSHYCASKAAVVMLARSMALELGEHGIRANAILPGYVEVEEGGTHLSAAYREASRTANPLGEPVLPEDIASVILTLASPAMAAVNGASIAVDRGSGAGRLAVYPTGVSAGAT